MRLLEIRVHLDELGIPTMDCPRGAAAADRYLEHSILLASLRVGARGGVINGEFAVDARGLLFILGIAFRPMNRTEKGRPRPVD